MFIIDRQKDKDNHLHQPLKLVKSQVKFLKTLLKELPQVVVVHDLHQDTESLLFRHLVTDERETEINILYTLYYIHIMIKVNIKKKVRK